MSFTNLILVDLENIAREKEACLGIYYKECTSKNFFQIIKSNLVKKAKMSMELLTCKSVKSFLISLLKKWIAVDSSAASC